MNKLKIAFLGGDNHAGTINDMFQDSLPNHPLVESVDWEWVGNRWGKAVKVAVGQEYILDNLSKYDLIFQNPNSMTERITPGLVELLNKLNLWNKVVLYDSADLPNFLFEEYQNKCLLYLKRSWVESHLPKNMSNVVPFDFPLFQEYLDVVPVDFSPWRDMHISCLLGKEGEDGSPRGQVLSFAKETNFSDVQGDPRPIHTTICYTSGEVLSSAATSYRDELVPPPPRINWWYVYMHLLRRTQILLTAANGTAVGDHRTWESFASGALVVTDKIPVPNPNNPEPWKHYIPFDLNEPKNTVKIVRELLVDHTERKRIALAGLEHAIKYHHSDARIAYVMEEILKRKED